MQDLTDSQSPFGNVNMDYSERLAQANKLIEAGCIDEAARVFHATAEEANDPELKAAILINEHKCYCQLGEFDRATDIMRVIRSFPVKDKYVRMVIDFGDACMTTGMGRLEEGARKFEQILSENEEQLKSSDNRYLYEDIRERRAFALMGIDRYAEALPILKEALSFTTDNKEDVPTVHFYLGVCYSSISEFALAKEEFLRAIALGLTKFEASARYRLAMLYLHDRAFAQAKFHLESALALPEGVNDVPLRRDIYKGLSRSCHYLREFDEERKYKALAKSCGK